MQFSSQQKGVFDFVENGSGHGVVEAVAGSGKTTTIIEALKYMDGDVFLGAFNNAMAKELTERAAKFPNVKCATFHSLGFSALKSKFRGEHLKVDGRKLWEVFKQVDLLPKQYAKLIVKMVSMAKIDGFDIDDRFPNSWKYQSWSRIIEKHGFTQDMPLVEDCDFSDYPHVKFSRRDDEVRIEMASIYNCAKEVLKKSNDTLSVIDFDDMIYLALLKQCRFKKYDWFLIDEAQDTSPVRLEIAKRSIKETARLLAVGDRYQSIYAFSGAMSSSIQHIQQTFQTTNLPLSTCYRCGKNIIAEAQKVNPEILPTETAIDGLVRRLPYKTMVETVLPGETILGRFNIPLIETAFELVRTGKVVSVSGSNPETLINFIKSFKVSSLDRLKAGVRKEITALYKEFMELDVKDEYYPIILSKLENMIDNVYLTISFYSEANRQGLFLTHEVYPMITKIMTENADSKAVRLSTIHKSKGMEFPTVYLLNERELGKPVNPDVPDHWRNIEERNLRYVAITRAKQEIVYIDMPSSNNDLDIYEKYKDLVSKEWASYPRD